MSIRSFLAVAILCSAPSGWVFADDAAIANSFEVATQREAHNSKTYELNGCLFEKKISVAQYCENVGLGTGGRTISQRLDLSEVRELRIRPRDIARGDQILRGYQVEFDLDIPTPGRTWALMDRLLSGSEGAFQRYNEKSRELRDSVQLNSESKASQCGGGSHVSMGIQMPFFFDVRPEGLEALAQRIEECRGDGAFEFIELDN